MLIKSCRDLGYHITCQIKSNKKILLNNQDSLSVKLMLNDLIKKTSKKYQLKLREKGDPILS